MTSRVFSDEFLKALAEELAPIVAELLRGKRGCAAHYSQQSGQRPAGCGKPKYLRVHKRAMAAGEPGAWCEGRSRLMTDECWRRLAKTLRRERAPDGAVDPDADILDYLGLEPKATVSDTLLKEFGARKAK